VAIRALVGMATIGSEGRVLDLLSSPIATSPSGMASPLSSAMTHAGSSLPSLATPKSSLTPSSVSTIASSSPSSPSPIKRLSKEEKGDRVAKLIAGSRAEKLIQDGKGQCLLSTSWMTRALEVAQSVVYLSRPTSQGIETASGFFINGIFVTCPALSNRCVCGSPQYAFVNDII
jgi:hypothetical protein